MARAMLHRLITMVLSALCLSLIVFTLTNLAPNLEKLARAEASARMSEGDVALWLTDHGYDRPLLLRYGGWLGVTSQAVCPDGHPGHCGLLQGNWGTSSRFKQDVGPLLAERMGATGWLMLWAMLVMVPASLVLGVLAGMREGSVTDRTLSTAAIVTTSTPEYVSGVILVAVFASATTGLSPILADWGWIEGRTLFLGTATGATERMTFWNFALPVATVALYGTGYVARMTRAAMVEVMAAPYIRTARLKGLGLAAIVWRHALRNALITPFTVIMLQFPWLLNGVVIVEILFNYKGFGWTLVQAAGNNDIDLVLGCTIVAVAVVLVTQLISDIGHWVLNPRIRVT